MVDPTNKDRVGCSDPEAAALGQQAAKTGPKAEDANENSAISFWSSSNSDSDDLNDNGGEGQNASDPTRRGRRGQGTRSRRRRSPGSPGDVKRRSVSDERKEFENARHHRSRSRDKSPNLAHDNYEEAGGQAHGSDGGRHHRRDRSNGSPYSRRSSQDRGEGHKYDGRRRGTHSGAAGPVGPGPHRAGNGGASNSNNFRGGGRNKQREGGEYTIDGFFFPSMSKPLVSLQQFSSMQNRQSDPFAIKSQYKQYCQQHKEKRVRAFWQEHEKEPWFIEKYNPMTIYQAKMEHIDYVRGKAQKFFAQIPFKHLDLTKREDSGLEGPQLHKFDPNSRTIYLKQIPVFVARVQLKEAVQSVTSSLEQIILSRPLQMHNFERFAWLVYDSEEHAEAAMSSLETLVIRAPSEANVEDFKLTPVKNNQSVKPPKVTPEMAMDHVARDIEICKRLIKEVFDVEKEIEFPFARLEAEVESSDARLDTLLLYLRQVHGYCFFCGVRCDDERQLSGKCASQHLRLPGSVDRTVFDTAALYGSARQFERAYLENAEKLLAKGPEEKPVDPQEDELLVETKNIYCLDKTREVVEGKKYVCEICEKAFKSTDFVVKHIKNKHEDRLVRHNYSFFKRETRENYLNELKQTADQAVQVGSAVGGYREGASGGNAPHFNNQRSGTDYFPPYHQRGRGGYHDQGGRGGHFNRRGGMQGGFMGAPPSGMMDDNAMDQADGGDKRDKGFTRAYVDYDDPTQFDGQGQKLADRQAAQSHLQHQYQQQQQHQQMLYKHGTGSLSTQGDRQLVSYDDLF